jgi:hypothetical protein
VLSINRKNRLLRAGYLNLLAPRADQVENSEEVRHWTARNARPIFCEFIGLSFDNGIELRSRHWLRCWAPPSSGWLAR